MFCVFSGAPAPHLHSSLHGDHEEQGRRSGDRETALLVIRDSVIRILYVSFHQSLNSHFPRENILTQFSQV